MSSSLETIINYNKKNKIIIKRKDCIDLLKEIDNNSINLIVTDPAYSGMNNKLKLGKGRIVGVYKERNSENGKWFKEFEDTTENYNIFLSECKRVLNKENGHIYLMFDSYSLLSLGHLVRNYFNVKNIITWDKVNLGMGHYFRRRHELIIFATNNNNRKIRNKSIPDVWRFKRIINKEYPTQKPVELFQAMIYASAKEGFNVCDPFVGSGSSAIAAIKNNCNFIGCDISEKAVEICIKRINYFINEKKDLYQNYEAHLTDEKKFWE